MSSVVSAVQVGGRNMTSLVVNTYSTNVMTANANAHAMAVTVLTSSVRTTLTSAAVVMLGNAAITLPIDNNECDVDTLFWLNLALL